MNESQINTFLTIVEQGTFSRAAEVLFLTQPSISHRMRTLEAELDAALFVRAPGAAELTPAGKAFLHEAQRLQQAYAAMHRAMRPYADRQQIIVGLPALMIQGKYAAYHAIMELNQKETPLQARIFNRPEEGRTALLDGDIDLIFSDVSLPCFAGSKFARKRLFDGGAYICVHRGHRLASKRQVALEDLAGETLLTYCDSTFFSTRVLRMLPEGTIMRQQGGDSPEEAARLLRPDFGVMVTNVRLAQESWLVYRPLALRDLWPVGLVWLARRQDAALLLLAERISALPVDLWRK